MEEKKIGNITVNDGKGFFDNDGLCDTLLLDLNKLPKSLAEGQYIQFCAIIAGMGQKIANLKKGIKAETDSLKNRVDDLKQLNDSLVEELNKKDGDDNGGS